MGDAAKAFLVGAGLRRPGVFTASAAAIRCDFLLGVASTIKYACIALPDHKLASEEQDCQEAHH